MSETKWDERVQEIWSENGLKHLRDAATPFEFIYDPSKGTYGFQEGYEVTEEDQDEFVFIDQSDRDELVSQLLPLQTLQDEPTRSVLFHPEKPQEAYQPRKTIY